MKRIIFVLVLCLVLVGCVEKKEKEIEPEGTINGYTYKITTGDNNHYKVRGYYIDTLNQPDAPWYYTVAMGKKNTGGYSINIKSLNIDEEGNARIEVKEKKPNKDEAATMAFTYPYVTIEVNKPFKFVFIYNTESEIFKQAN